jgi:fibronectin-binding autotransporter adhesin
MAVLLVTVGALPVHALDPNALPTGGRIAAGTATISQSGNRLNVNQASDRAILNWSTFNIGANAAVNFAQPHAGSVALNRVLTSAGASDIQGRLTANGQIFLVNPSGVLFGKGAQVDVGGLVASTLDISDTDFLVGRNVFSRAGAAGSIVNQGTLNAAQGGYIALLAPEVRNEGVITARLGSVALAAGNQVTLDFAGDRLVSLAVDQAAVDALVENRHLIQTDGGNVILAARSAGDLAATVVNNTGLIQATSVSRQNGVIRLEGLGTGVVASTGTIDASGRSAGETGGSVKLLGDRVGLMAGAVVDASGDVGGGSVLVGGNYQGQGPERNASFTFIDPTAGINADVLGHGDGGTVIAWADDTTRFYGSISAKGAGAGGNGGFVETSGKRMLMALGQVDASAPGGLSGTWLLDPNNITIQAAGSDTSVVGTTNLFSSNDSAIVTTARIQNALNAGTSVAVTTNAGGTNGQAGDITVASAIAKTAGGNATLTLNAYNDIVFNPGANVSSSAGQLGITLNAGRNISSAANINTNGGLLRFNAAGASSTQSGVVSGAGGLTKTGTGMLALSGANTYTGATTVSAGTLNLQNNTATGTTAGGVTVAAGAALQLQGDITVGAEALSINGTGVGGTGALRNISGNNTWGGLVTLAGNSEIQSDAGLLTLSAANSVAGNTRTLTFDGAGNGLISGTITTTTGGLTKIGIGSLTLQGANTYTGATTVSAGTLNIQSATALGGTGTGTTVATGAALELQGGITVGAEALSINGTGVGGNGALRNISGNNTWGGLVTQAGNSEIQSDAGLLTLGAANSVAGNTRTLTFDGAGDGLISGTITTTTGGLIKNGAGTLTLQGSNTYTGASTVNAGTLTLSGANGSSTTSAFTVNKGGTLTLDNGAANNLNRLGDALALRLNGGEFKFIGSNVAATNASETVGALTLPTNASTITAVAGTGGATRLTFASANRTAGAMALFRGDNLGAAAGAGNANIDFTALAAANLVGGNTTMVNKPIVTWATGDSTSTGSGVGFVTYNIDPLSNAANTTGIRPLSLATEYATATGVAGVNLHVPLSVSPDVSRAFNSILLSGGSTYTIGAAGAAKTLTVTSGAIFSASGLANTITGRVTPDVLALGAVEGKVSTLGDLNVTTARITGTGGLTKSGTNSLTLGSANTYTGTTTINAGTLFEGVSNAISTGAVTVRSGGIFDLNNNSDAIGALTLESGTAVGASVTTGTGTLTLGGNVTLNASGTGDTGATIDGNLSLGATRTFTVNNGAASNDLTVSALVSGAGGLTKAGTGTLALSAANTYTGATSITAGVLSANSLANGGVASSIGQSTNAAANLVLGGGTLQYTGATASTDRNFTLTAATTSSIDVSSVTSNLTLSGASTATTGNLTKIGSGTLTLSGANLYTGRTTINAGVLRANTLANGGAASSIGASTNAAANLVLGGGTLQYTGGTVSTDRNYTLTAGTTSTVDVTTGGTTLVISGASTATTGALTKIGTGTLTLSGANLYTGLTTINAGTLRYGAANALSTGAVTVNDGGTCDLAGFSDSIGALAVNSGATGGTVTTGAGTLTLTGNITSTGGASNASIGGNLAFAATRTITTTNAADGLTVSAAISGAGGLTKAGVGTLTLSGDSSYTGITTIGAGTLKLGATGGAVNTPLGTVAAGTSITAGAVLDLNGFTPGTDEALTLRGTGIANGGALTNSSATGASYNGLITLGAASSIVTGPGDINLANAGTITGATFGLTLSGSGNGFISSVIGTTSGTLIKNGAGSWTLGNANSYTGLTTVDSGTLVAAANGALGTTANGTTITSGATLGFSGNINYATAEAITVRGAGDVLNSRAGAIDNISGANSFAGAITLGTASTIGATAGTLTLSGALNNAGNLLTFNTNTGDINESGLISGAGGLTKSGTGTLTLSGANSYSGVTTVSGGTLVASHASALGSTLGGTSVAGGATLEITNGTVIGAETLNVSGVGVGSNGALVVTAGSASIAGAVTLDASASIGGNGSLTLGGTVEDTAPGTSTLTQVGSGTLTFSGTVGATNALAGMTTSVGQTTAINGGAITTTGAQTYNGAVTLGANTTLASTGSGNIAFNGTLNGAHALTVNTTGTTTFGGVVGGVNALTTLTTNFGGTTAINGGAITTTGNQNYADGVTLGADAVLDAGAGNFFFSTVNGAHALTANSTGATNFNGIVGGTTALASLTTDAAGTTAINTTGITTTGAQTYNDAVALGADTTLTSTGLGDIAFGGAVNGGAVHALTVNTDGTTTFNGIVGGGPNALTTLTTDAGGITAINTTGITTTGAQTYNDAVTLGANTTLTGSNMAFNGTLNGAHALTVNTTGTTTFGGIVGGTTALTSLMTDAGGTTVINGGAITTSAAGGQVFGDAVTLGANTTLNAGTGAITFSSTVDGLFSLAANTTGTTTFGGVVGGVNALTTLTTNFGGTTAINGGAITTTGNQNYADGVTLGADAVLDAGAGNFFFSTVNGAHALTANSTGATNFNGIVGGTTALASLTTDAAGTTAINTTGITTTGAQTYNDAVALGADTTLTSTGLGDITFGGAVNGGAVHALTVNTDGTTTFNGIVGGGPNALTTLTTDAGGITAINTTGITTTGAQTYNDAVTLGANTTLTGSNMAFNGTLNGAHALTVNTTGTTTFGGIVGGITPLTSLTTDAGGTTAINGGAITTSGAQIYNDDVTLGTATVLTTTNSDITVAGTVNAGGNMLTLLAGSGNVLLNNAGNDFGIVGVISANNATLVDTNDLTLGTSGFAGTLTANASGKITLGGSLTAGGAGDAIVLVAGTDFDNSGNHSLNPGTGRWLVYSTDPGNDTRGAGLLAAYDFKQYNTTFGGGILGSGDGFIYSLAPTVTAGLTGTASKVYNGNNSAALAPANYTISGVVDSDTVTLNNPATGTYDDKNVGAGKTVTVTGIGFVSTENSGKLVYGYQLASTTANANIGEITPKALTSVSLTGSVSKVYDGNATVANLGTANYSIAGFIGGEGATITNTLGSYDNGASVAANPAGSAVTSAALVAGDYTANVGTTLSNYTLITGPVVGNIGEITPKALTSVSLTGSVSKVYDGNATVANLGTANYSIAGFIGGEGATITNTLGSYDNGASVAANPAGSAVTSAALVAGDYTANVGTTLSNYTLITGPVVGNIGEITPKALTSVSLTGSVSKVYDGNATVANLGTANYSIAGFIGGEGATITNTLGSYDNGASVAANPAGSAVTSAALVAGDYTANVGTTLSNYTLITGPVVGNIGEITPKALTSVSLTGSVSKVYDGNATVANLGTANYSIAGFIGGEGATITNTLGSYDNGASVAANPAGSAVTSAALVAGDYTANVGTTLSNYTLITGPVVGNIGEITPKALTSVSLTGSVSRVYDGNATVANLGTANYSIAGFIGGEGATITNTLGSYDNGASVAANPAGSAVTSAALVAGDYTANVGTTLSNYTLITGPVVGNIGEITPKALTSVSLTGSVSKVYDGNATVANLGTANYSIAGFIGGEGATITNTLGSYDNGASVAANPAGSAVTSAALVAGDYTANVGTTLSNYTLITGPVVGNIGEITPKALTSVSLTGSVSKVYDGNATVANLGTANYSIAGFIGGEGATITNTLGSYDNGASVAANPAGSAVTSAALVAGDYTANVGTTLSNYTLITGPVVGNIGEITPKALTSVSLTGSVSKVYDGNATVANLGTANYSIAGFIGGEGATITNTLGSYDNGASVAANPAGSAVTSAALVAGDYTANVGTTLSNYTLITGPVVGNIGEITPKALTSVSLTGSVSKVYDGNATVANLGTANYSIAGFIGGEGATITNTLGSYDNGASVAANPAGSAVTSAALVAGDYTANVGTTLSNYTLITGPVVGNIGEITPKALTSVSLTGSVSKVYDGNATVANLGTANYSIAGFIGGEGATITNTLGSYDNGASVAANPAGSAVTSAALVAGDYTANVGTTLSNYTLITGPVVGNIGEITPKALTSVSLTGSVSRVYDGNATVANLGTANYSIAGFIGGEGATITNTLGSYDNGASVAANPAGSAVTSAALVAGDYTANVGTTLSNYTLITGPVVGNIGEITPKALTSVSLTGSVSKVYDGNATVANLGTANYSIAGFIGGEGATITNTLGSYDNGASVAANPAGSAVTSAALVAGDYTANVGTTLSNYTLITGPVVGNIGEITPKALTSVSLTGSVSKVYDGNATVANLGTANYSIAGFIGGEGATITNTLGSYDNGASVAANPAGSAVTSAALVAGDYTANVGTTLSNYTLITGPVVGNIGEITPKALTSVSLTGSVSKVYDGNATVANLGTANYSIAGFIGGEGATITNTLGSYDNGASVAANPAGSAVTSAALVAGDYTANVGTTLSNYTLITGPVVGNIGEITPKALTVTADNKFKAAGTPNPPFTASYSGFVAGEGLGDLGGSLLFSTPATVASPVGSYLVTPSGLTSSNYTIGFIDGLLFVADPATVSNPAATGAITSIFAIDDRFIRTSVEPGGGLVDALNPQPPPTEKQASTFISVVDCGINVPGSVCNSR